MTTKPYFLSQRIEIGLNSQNLSCMNYVMTVGADRPVYSSIFESFNATSTCSRNIELNQCLQIVQ